MDPLNPNNISYSYIPQGMSQASLSCETPLTYLLLNSSSPGECAAATLKSLANALGVSVLCSQSGEVSKELPNPVSLMNGRNWAHSGFLNKINSTAVCPEGQDMQLVGIFNGSVSGKFSLDIENSEDICANSVNNPLSRLERDLQVANTTFKIGLNAKESICYPDYVRFPTPFEDKYFNPLADLLSQHISSVHKGCQTITLESTNVEDKSYYTSVLGRLYCGAWSSNGPKLTPSSKIGDNITCGNPAWGPDQSLPLIVWVTGNVFQESFNNLTTTFKRVVTPCGSITKVSSSSATIELVAKTLGYLVAALVPVAGFTMWMTSKKYGLIDVRN